MTADTLESGHDPRTERVVLMMSKTELKALDEWRFANRFNTRSEAMRFLIFFAQTINLVERKDDRRSAALTKLAESDGELLP